MTNLHPTDFTFSVRREPGTLIVRVAGELDYDTSGDLTDAVVEHLADAAPLHHVRLDFSELTWLDSTGLSALLMIHRRTSAVGARLHLDHRPEVLERMLRMTNVLEYLTGPALGTDTKGRKEDDDFARG
ncbi:STAS domain-containing protein [Streptomyces sp. NPDC052301]|uniref:STAS domain-containing protein n=1 Tax=Streptomyces sp. NPDC052301 TaxID=3365687 RepID=UPI0037D32244